MGIILPNGTIPARISVTAWIGTAIALGAILVSVGGTMQTVKYQSSRIEETRVQIREIRSYIEQRTDDRYHARDAARDLAYVDQRLQRIEERLSRIENAKK